MEVTLQRPIAARRIGIQTTPRLDRKIGRFLHRLRRAIFGRVEDDSPVSDHRGSNSQPIDFEGVEIYPIFMAKIENTEKPST